MLQRIFPGVSESQERRFTFDEVAELYDRVRPGYPPELVRDLLSMAQIPQSGRILEVGCGTGQATLSFAPCGFQMLCLEPGENLAALARKNCSRYPNVEIRNVTFEQWPVESEAFDFLISAQAFHWVDPLVRFSKAAQALRPAGGIGLFWNRPRALPAELQRPLREAYERHAPRLAAWEPNKESPRGEIDQSGRFGHVIESDYPWRCEYDASGYVSLMQTHSDHRMLPRAVRAKLLEAVRRVIERSGGRVRVEYTATLYLARRLS